MIIEELVLFAVILYKDVEIIILSLIAIPLELFSKKGSDNLTLPIGIAVLTYLVESWM